MIRFLRLGSDAEEDYGTRAPYRTRAVMRLDLVQFENGADAQAALVVLEQQPTHMRVVLLLEDAERRPHVLEMWPSILMEMGWDKSIVAYIFHRCQELKIPVIWWVMNERLHQPFLVTAGEMSYRTGGYPSFHLGNIQPDN